MLSVAGSHEGLGLVPAFLTKSVFVQVLALSAGSLPALRCGCGCGCRDAPTCCWGLPVELSATAGCAAAGGSRASPGSWMSPWGAGCPSGSSLSPRGSWPPSAWCRSLLTARGRLCDSANGSSKRIHFLLNSNSSPLIIFGLVWVGAGAELCVLAEKWSATRQGEWGHRCQAALQLQPGASDCRRCEPEHCLQVACSVPACTWAGGERHAGLPGGSEVHHHKHRVPAGAPAKGTPCHTSLRGAAGCPWGESGVGWEAAGCRSWFWVLRGTQGSGLALETFGPQFHTEGARLSPRHVPCGCRWGAWSAEGQQMHDQRGWMGTPCFVCPQRSCLPGQISAMVFI